MVGISAAVSSILFLKPAPGDLQLKRPYHVTSHWDMLMLSNGTMEFPQAIQPPSAARHAAALSAACYLAVCASKTKHAERWFIGGIFLGTIFMLASKYHAVDNGLHGHLAGFWGSVLGCCGMVLRMVGARNSVGFIRASAVLFALNTWYEVGRFHLWNAWTGEFKRALRPAQARESVWADFVPSDVKEEYLIDRPLHSQSARPSSASPAGTP